MRVKGGGASTPVPLPGMDPYLEARWSGVHVALIAYIQEALQPKLPHDLRARAEERVLLETADGADPALYRSDVAVVEVDRPGPRVAPPTGVATVEPVLVEVHSAPRIDRFVQIIDLRRGNRVITAIEVLSREYRRNLADYARGGVNLVEIDLLRGARGRLEVGPEDLPAHRRAPYLTCVRRQSEPDLWEVYPMPLHERLPSVPVPLRQGESDIALELQPLVDRVYAAGGHDDIDYRQPADPPLEGEDAQWAGQLLRSAGRI